MDQLDELPYNSDFIRLLTDFSYLPAYCKFGVYNRNMIEILESGLYERELLIKVHTLFELHTQLVEYDLQLFYSWASAVTLVDVEDRNIKISKHEKQMWNDYKKSILGEIKLEIDIVSVSIKGYGMYDRKYLVRGEPLILIHEPENQYDPNAIKILSLDNKMLGYVPKGQTEIINDFIINKKAWMVFNKIDKGERVCYLYIIK